MVEGPLDQYCPGLSVLTEVPCVARSSTGAVSRLWLLSPRDVPAVTEELNFKYILFKSIYM